MCCVLWDVLFGGTSCLAGCFVWLDALFGGMLCLVGKFFLFGQNCLFGGTVFVLVGGVLCTGVDVLYGVIFCLVQCFVPDLSCLRGGTWCDAEACRFRGFAGAGLSCIDHFASS